MFYFAFTLKGSDEVHFDKGENSFLTRRNIVVAAVGRKITSCVEITKERYEEILASKSQKPDKQESK